MKSTYIILRSLKSPTRNIFAGPLAVNRMAAPPELNPIVEIEHIDRKSVSNLVKFDDVVAVAPAMPMKLIEPFKSALPAGTINSAWGIAAVGADSSPYTGRGVTVAILDTGVNTSHTAFTGVQFVEKDFTGDGNGDEVGHGTHCCGTICGRDVEGQRIGVAQGVENVLVGKVLGKNGGSSETISRAILWAIENGANVISMSLGIDFPGFSEHFVSQGYPVPVATSLALEGYRENVKLFESLASLVKARSNMGQGAIIIAAAGNESRRDENVNWEIAVSPPAVADGILSVAALANNPNGFTVAPFSNTGANVAAPGVEILSANKDGGLLSLSGTSMATPHVAGVACLWAEKLRNNRHLTSFELMSRLVGNASSDNLNPIVDPNDVGAGLVLAPQN